MERFARLARPKEGSPIRLIDARRCQGFGFFDLLEEHFGGVHQDSGGTPLLTPLHRVCSLTRGHRVRTILIEEIDIADAEELQEENDDLAGLGWWQQEHFALRISFFRAVIPKKHRTAPAAADPAAATAQAKAFVAGVSQEDFIGYAIWKQDKGEHKPGFEDTCRRVYEAVLPPPPEQYIHVRGIPTCRCRLAGREFLAVGLPFYQQNGVTNVCSHAAVRTLVSCFKKELSFREMNNLLHLQGEDFTERKGLFTDEIERLVKSIGVKCVQASYNPDVVDEQPVVQFQRYVYGSIESGFPAIIVFGQNVSGSVNGDGDSDGNCDGDGNGSGDGGAQPAKAGFLHAVTVFGHTFNRHMWVPRVEATRFRLDPKAGGSGFLPSDLWAGSFVGHDDTLGPHFTIPRHYMRGMRSALHDRPQHPPAREGVAHVICAQPLSARMRPIDAELTAVGWLNTMLDGFLQHLAPRWGRRMLQQRETDNLVLRPLLVEKDEYLRHLAALQGWDRQKERVPQEMLRRLEEEITLGQLWMVEVSLQELFPTNWRKVGEVLIDPQFSKEDFALGADIFNRAVVGVRLPGVWLGPCTGAAGASERAVMSCPITTHSNLFGCPDEDEEGTTNRAAGWWRRCLAKLGLGRA